MKLTFNYDQQNNRINVDAQAVCGREFERVAVILEPNSPNPGLMVPRALGLKAIGAIMEGLIQWKISQVEKLEFAY